jgi:hypothetical protein
VDDKHSFHSIGSDMRVSDTQNVRVTEALSADRISRSRTASFDMSWSDLKSAWETWTLSAVDNPSSQTGGSDTRFNEPKNVQVVEALATDCILTFRAGSFHIGVRYLASVWETERLSAVNVFSYLTVGSVIRLSDLESDRVIKALSADHISVSLIEA